MTCDIFCVTYAKDAPWLEYMLRSCRKFTQGFRRVLVVFPSTDLAIIHEICEKFNFVQEAVFEQWGNGHAHQTALKSSPDLYSDADYFLMIDSDCVFIRPVTPDDFFTHGKSDLEFIHYDNPAAEWREGRLPWKEITDFALGAFCDYETMRRFPFFYPAWLFRDLRVHIEKLHGKPFDRYVREAVPMGRGWHGYSEFCSLGAYALLFAPARFHLIDLSDHQKVKPESVRQLWSHSGLTPEERIQLEEITRMEPEQIC